MVSIVPYASFLLINTTLFLFPNAVGLSIAVACLILLITIPSNHKYSTWQLRPVLFACFIPIFYPYIYESAYRYAYGRIILSCIGAAVSIIMETTLPIDLKLPPLKQKVGRVYLEFESKTKNEKGIGIATCWMPLRALEQSGYVDIAYSEDKLAPLIPRHLKQHYLTALPAVLNIPAIFKFLFSHLASVASRSYDVSVRRRNAGAEADADDMKNDKFKLAVFSHGMHGIPENYCIMAETLASMGYIVVAITHQDGSAPVVAHPNGTLLQGVHGHRIPDDDDKKGYKEMLDCRVGELEDLIDTLYNCDCDASIAACNCNEQQLMFKCISSLVQQHHDILLIGHSFGGATAALTKTRHVHDNTFRDMDIGVDRVLYDPWFWPCSSSSSDSKSLGDVDIPHTAGDITVVSSNWILEKPARLAFINDYVRIQNDLGDDYETKTRSVLVDEATHHSFNDMPFIVKSKWIRRYLGFSTGNSGSSDDVQGMFDRIVLESRFI